MKARKTLVGTIDQEVLAFTVGKDPVLDLALAEADCYGTAAHAIMLSRMPVKPPILTADAAARVLRALGGILHEIQAGHFRISGRDQDVHLAIERMLTERLGDLGKRVHTARSRNDQVAVDLRLYGKTQLLDLAEETAGLAATLLSLGRKHASVPMVGRTHLQPAMPSSVGVWASAYAESLLDDLHLIKAAYEVNDQCPLGSAAGYGVPLPIDRVLTARLLGFSAPIHNVLCASNARGKCEAAILSAASQIMISLSRLAEDLMLYSMPEFGYFSLPAEFCTGSSIMPQKHNPDVLELVRARASRVLGQASTVSAIVQALPGGYNRDLQETKEPFMEGLSIVRSCVRILNRLAQGVAVHREALAAGFGPGVFAADRALELVAEGVPFRDAYQRVRENPDLLRRVRPEEALRRRTHLGTAAGLHWAIPEGRMRQVKRWVRKERMAFERALARLLGARNPKA